MKIDLSELLATFTFKPEAEETEGEKKSLRVDLKLNFHAAPSFLDAYFDGHLSGLPPSTAFWRTYGEDKPGQYTRYLWLEKILLNVAKEGRYVVKLKKERPHGVGNDSFDGYREALLADGQVKKLTVEFMKDFAIVEAKLRFHGVPQETITELAGLAVDEGVRLDFYNAQGDLVSQANATPVRGEPDKDDEDEKEPAGEPAETLE